MADTAVTTQQKISPEQRAANFAVSTRQHLQMLPKKSVTSGGTSMQVELPKTRLLSKIIVDFKVTYNLKHASLTAIPTVPYFAPYKVLRRLTLDLNNGFQPVVIDGQGLAMYSMIRLNPDIVKPQNTNSRGANYFPTPVASSGGTDNTYNFTVEIPVTLNNRDTIGMILLQNEQTQVTLTADIVNGAEMFNNASGFTVNISSVEMQACAETFTVPVVPSAFPDISVLKLINSKVETLVGSGQNTIKLQSGNIYRKLLLYVEDTSGVAFDDSDFTSNIELVFNQADSPYSIKAETLAHKNEIDLGFGLPKGLFIFDFSTQGVPNMGSIRDYIDSGKLTEFWVRFSSQKAGKITIISETLARLV